MRATEEIYISEYIAQGRLMHQQHGQVHVFERSCRMRVSGYLHRDWGNNCNTLLVIVGEIVHESSFIVWIPSMCHQPFMETILYKLNSKAVAGLSDWYPTWEQEKEPCVLLLKAFYLQHCLTDVFSIFKLSECVDGHELSESPCHIQLVGTNIRWTILHSC